MTRIKSSCSCWLAAAALLLLGCSPSEQPAQPPDSAERPLVITGELAYRARIAVPPDTVALVELRESNDETVIVARQRISLQGRQVPVAFELTAETADLDPEKRYSLHAALLLEEQALWVNEGIAIGAQSGVLDLRTVWLERAPVEPGSSAVSLRCGELDISISVVDDRLTLFVGQERTSMRQVEAASGERFVAENDPSTIFWYKGDSATLSLRGETYPECEPVPARSEASGEVVQARGNEPAWMLLMADGELRLELDYGQTRITVPQPVPAREDDLVRYRVRTADGQVIDVTLRDEVCTDTMTGMPYPGAATVRIDGRELRGCAGEPHELLVGEAWVVEDIDGEGVIERARVTLNFEPDGRLGGHASCNTYTGSYSIGGENISVSVVASTLMACSPALMAQEQTFFALLEALTRFEIPDTAVLVLHAADGTTLTARR
ncbi:MAG: META domain-containing protein [Gammaproteobacteria bacterium]|nr:META domain-containing protein [Gammaproteobacteria bacterium]